MQSTSLRLKIILGNLLPLVFLVVLGALSYRSIASLVESNQWVTHTHQTIGRMSAIEKLVLDLETGERGFLITGKERFLAPYHRATAEMPKQLEAIRELVSDNPEQVARVYQIGTLITKWKLEAGDVEISLRREIHEGAIDAKRLEQLLSAGVGKGVLDKLRVVFDKLDAEFSALNMTEARRLVLAMAKDMVDMETGQRGFLVTGKEEFLEPYINGQSALLEHDKALRRLTLGGRFIRVNRDLQKAMALAQQWQEQAARPELAARREMNATTTTLGDVVALIESEKGKSIVDAIRETTAQFIQVEQALLVGRIAESSWTATSTSRVLVIGTLATIVASLLLSFLFARRIAAPVVSLMEAAREVAAGDLSIQLKATTNDEVGQLSQAFNDLVTGLRSASDDEEQAKRELTLKNSELAQDAAFRQAQARLGELMRGEHELGDLMNSVVAFLAEYINAHLGALYVFARVSNDSNDSNDSKALCLVGTFAFARRKRLSSQLELGDDLVGQAALERKSILISDVPSDYVKVASALGESTPRSLLVVPLLFGGRLKGVIELGSLTDISDAQIRALESMAEAVAATIDGIQGSERIHSLLERTQAQAGRLKLSEEGLQAQSDQLQSANDELARRASSLESQARDLEATNQAIQRAKEEVEAKAEDVAQASRYKSEFLANMSHELRTPLNSLLILAKLLHDNDEGNLTSEQIESAKVIEEGGRALLALINDILDLSKVEAGKMDVVVENTDPRFIADNLETVFSPVAKRGGVALSIVVDPAVPDRMYTDNQRVEQILKNLLSNAFKFTEKGAVSLRVSRPSADVSFTCEGLIAARCIAFSVTDTGIGIPEQKQRAIFEAFQQADGSTSRQYGGTGLGLTISKELTRLLGGELTLSSRPGHGSTFTLYLPESFDRMSLSNLPPSITTEVEPLSILPSRRAPIQKGGQSGSTKAVSAKQRPRADRLSVPARASLPDAFEDDRRVVAKGDRVVLVIEDDASFASALREHARRKGYKCIVAGTGASGLKLAQDHLPAAIILDLGLPDMDGSQVLGVLKFDLRTRHIPVQVISANDRNVSLLKEGAVEVLVKPLTSHELDEAFGTLERLLGKTVKRLLLVEDDAGTCSATAALLHNDALAISVARTGRGATELLAKEHFDCVILDLKLPDISGFDLLEDWAADPACALPPVVVHTGRELSTAELKRLEAYAAKVIVKGPDSSERLLNETSLFLHGIEEQMLPAQRKVMRALHDPKVVLQGRRVLVVDDDMRNVFALTKVLQSAGLKVLTAENGQRALEVLESEPDVELVLMDIMMPVMDGYEAMRRIRAQEKFKDLPVVAFTAKAMPEDRQRCLDAGANDFVTKPVNTDDLMQLMLVRLYSQAGA